MMLDLSAISLPRCAEHLRNGNNPEDGQEPSAENDIDMKHMKPTARSKSHQMLSHHSVEKVGEICRVPSAQLVDISYSHLW